MIIKYISLIFIFISIIMFIYYILINIKISRDLNQNSIIFKILEQYKITILKFNKNVFKFKLKEKFILYLYFILATIIGIIIYFFTKTFLFFIFIYSFLYYLPRFILNSIEHARRVKIENQLISALIFLNNSMKAGLDIVQGLKLALKSLEPPIQNEFALVLKEYNLGETLENSLINMKNRIYSNAIDTFVTAIIIQRESGGNITKIIEKIIETIRETNKLKNKIKTLTSQGRIQSIIVIILPWALGLILLVVQPDFMLPMFKTTLGVTLLGILIFWQFIGILVIKKITMIDI